MSTEISAVQHVKTILNSGPMQDKLKEMLGQNTAAFCTSVVQIMQSNDMLRNAEPNSVIGAALTATTLDLPLNNALGFAYIVPFFDRKSNTTKAQFMIGAKGFRQLAIRSGQFKVINESDVRQGEIKSRNRMTGEIVFNFVENESEREKLPVIGYVSYFELLNGYSSTFYMTVEELKKHAEKYSATYKKKFGVWFDDFPSMATKTVAKLNISKNAPLSIALKEAILKDQSVYDPSNEKTEYLDNSVKETEEAEVQIIPDDEEVID